MTSNHYLIKTLLLTALFLGCKSKNISKESIPELVSTNNITSESTTDSTIYLAAINGNTKKVLEFIENGISVDATDEDGRTALMYSSYNGHTQLAGELIKRGADVNQSDNNGRNALMFASSGPFPETVKLLLDNNADPNIADKEEHFTALMYASSEGQLDNVKLLLAYKSDPSLKDADGDSALVFAINNGHTQIVNLLQAFSRMQNNKTGRKE